MSAGRAAAWALAMGALLLGVDARGEESDVCQAEERGSWQAELNAATLSVRPPVGGVLAGGRHVWRVGGWGLGAGGELAVFGLGAGPDWIGVLGGPTIAVETPPMRLPARMGVATVTLGAAADAGRLKVCNTWGICPHFRGLYPSATLGARYVAHKHFDTGLAITARWIRTYVYEGISWEPVVGGRFFW